MIEHGKVKSTVAPEPLLIDEVNVWVHSNIVPVEEVVGEETFKGFEYDMIQYEKDEYIRIMAEQNKTLGSQMTDTQLALIEIYEGMAV
ncbi:hypothetical protein [Streptococcus parasuis]|uniref:hypothetical protein n=1 Tax=Streptococcus parasuis TaxID=1501662 RepID=UPI00370D1DB5